MKQYAKPTIALFQAIASAGGTSVIVDSSKHPVRALALSNISDADLRVIHLVRDAGAVAWSFAKSFAENVSEGIQRRQSGVRPWRTAIRWDTINAQAEWIIRQMPRQHSIRIRYEDLVDNPHQVLARIGELIAVDLSAVAESVSSGRSIAIGHVVAGNRLRMQQLIRLASDDEWRRLMPMRDRRLVQSLTFPLMARYGYR